MPSPIRFRLDQDYGFWRQIGAKPFRYDTAYQAKQSTTPAMARLRFSWVQDNLSPLLLKKLAALDVGAGKRVMRKEGKKLFTSWEDYDIVLPSITKERLCSQRWGFLWLTDVLEHMSDINDLFVWQWKYAYVTIPECPPWTLERLVDEWKHCKPDEHLWMLNMRGLVRWAFRKGAVCLAAGSPEDDIRKPWNPMWPNTTTMLFARNI